jgi:hypothetical protein
VRAKTPRKSPAKRPAKAPKGKVVEAFGYSLTDSVAAEGQFSIESTFTAEAEVVTPDYAPDTKLVRDQIERLTKELLAAIAADPGYLRAIDAELREQRRDRRNHNLIDSSGYDADSFPTLASEAENLTG